MPGAKPAGSRTATSMNGGVASRPRRLAVSSITKPSPTSSGLIVGWRAKCCAALIATSGPMPLGSPRVIAMRMRSEGERHERIEAAAIAHGDAFDESQLARGIGLDPVAVTAGREDIHRAVAHDAHDQERRLGLGDAVLLAQHHRQADDMTIALALVDVGLAQRRHAVLQ